LVIESDVIVLSEIWTSNIDFCTKMFNDYNFYCNVIIL